MQLTDLTARVADADLDTALAIAAGDISADRAVHVAMRHGYQTANGEPPTVGFVGGDPHGFDLGMRLWAFANNTPAERLDRRPLPPAEGTVAAIDLQGQTVTIEVAGQNPVAADSRKGIALLRRLLSTNLDSVAPRVLVPNASTLYRLFAMCDKAIEQTGDTLNGAAALVQLLTSLTKYPSTRMLVSIADALPQTYAPGVHPDADRDLTTWIDWFGITAPTTTGRVLALHDRLVDPNQDPTTDARDKPLWKGLVMRTAAGREWKDLPTDRAMAVDLKRREASGSLAADRLLADRRCVQSQRHNGYAVTGAVHKVNAQTVVVAADDPCRHKEGGRVRLKVASGLFGDVRVLEGAIDGITISADGTVLISIEPLTKAKKGEAGVFSKGDRAVVLPEAANPARDDRGISNRDSRLKLPSWATHRKATPPPIKREVPLAVLGAWGSTATPDALPATTDLAKEAA